MSRFTRVLVFAVALLVSSQACAKSPFSFVKFRKSKSVAQSSMLLTEDNGPWMIFVASFAGGGADAEARQLVETLRTKYRFNAFVHKEHYDFSDSVNGKGFDKHGRPKKMRFASDHAYDEVAVLVGDYESINDPKMQKQMQAIKYATAAELQLKGSKDSPTTRRFAGLRSIQKKLTNRDEKRQKGPLGNAFATRNPMIPREATAPSGIDRLLVDINKGVEYSLLDNPPNTPYVSLRSVVRSSLTRRRSKRSKRTSARQTNASTKRMRRPRVLPRYCVQEASRLMYITTATRAS